MIIQSERVWLSGSFFPAHITVEHGQILDIRLGLTTHADHDFGPRRIVPGFIDMHTHGGWNYDTNEDDATGLCRWAACLPQAALPTSITVWWLIQARWGGDTILPNGNFARSG